MPKQRIRRTGGTKLVFEGELLLKLDNRRSATVERKHWFEVAVYRVDKAQNFEAVVPAYLGKVTLCSVLPKQPAHEWVRCVSIDFHWNPVRPSVVDVHGVARALFLPYDPLANLVGFPPIERFREQESQYRAQVEADWRALLDDVCLRFE